MANQWYQDNRERFEAARKARYERDREAINARRRARAAAKRAEHGSSWTRLTPEQKAKASLSSKRHRFKKQYGMTFEDYERMSAQQGGVCAICAGSPSGKRPFLYVDHDHGTGKVRGLLCNSCNAAIGHFKDDAERLRSAIRYLASETEAIGG